MAAAAPLIVDISMASTNSSRHESDSISTLVAKDRMQLSQIHTPISVNLTTLLITRLTCQS